MLQKIINDNWEQFSTILNWKGPDDSKMLKRQLRTAELCFTAGYTALLADLVQLHSRGMPAEIVVELAKALSQKGIERMELLMEEGEAENVAKH